MMRIAAALFSALSLGSLLVVGLDQRSLFGESSAPARSNLPNISSLTENVRRYGPEQIEELLLVAAPQPCISTGSCNIVGVILPDDADTTTPPQIEPYLITAAMETTIVAKLQELSDAYFALAEDPEQGEAVRGSIDRLTALGRYPFVVPPLRRVEGGEAQQLARSFVAQFAPPPAPSSFSIVFLLPYLLLSLIPLGALRWALASKEGTRSLTVLPGLTVGVRRYGLLSGVALLLLAAIAVATSAITVLFGAYVVPVTLFAALAGATTLLGARSDYAGVAR